MVDNWSAVRLGYGGSDFAITPAAVSISAILPARVAALIVERCEAMQNLIGLLATILERLDASEKKASTLLQ